MKYIYVGGDSFCACRTNKQFHWPLILANMTNLQLEGKGFPGISWWHTRKHLIDYMHSDKFNDTEYFVLVHTDIDRCLVDSTTPVEEQIKNFYYKHIHSYEINHWAMLQYFKELNTMFESKKVIHLHGFPTSMMYKNILDGINLLPSLITMSLHELEGNNKINHFINDHRDNHFTAESNKKIAQIIFQSLTSTHKEIQISL